tara:strand:- start:34 stop:264 length:231 start_codon:yes stop_codon:yes gene_type:complete
MANYHIIKTLNNIIENTIQWDGDNSAWSPPSGYYALEVGISTIYQGCIGDKYNSGGVGIATTSTDTNCMWIPEYLQ